MSIFGFFLILFNDPLALFNLLDPFTASPLILAQEIGLFYAGIVFFLLVMASRINRDGLRLDTQISAWKYILSLLLGLCIIFGMVFFAYSHEEDPAYDIDHEARGLELTYQSVSDVVMFMCIFYIGANFLMFAADHKKRPQRYKIFVALTSVYILVEFIVVYFQLNNFYNSGSAAYMVLIFSNNYYLMFVMNLYKAHQPEAAKKKKEETIEFAKNHPEEARRARKKLKRRIKTPRGARKNTNGEEEIQPEPLADMSMSFAMD